MSDAPRLQGPGRNNSPEPSADLVGRLVSLKRQVDDLTGSILKSAGLKAEPNLLRVLGSLIVEGDLAVPNGSIDNDALASPIGWAWARNAQTNFAVGTAPSQFATMNLPHADGFSSMLVLCAAFASVVNSTAAYDFLYVKARVNAETSGSMPYPAGASGIIASGSMIHTTRVDGLTDGSGTTISAELNTQGSAWAANASNRAFVVALGISFR